MVNSAFVKIWGEVIGAVTWREEQKLAFFEFDKDFLALNWDIAPLKMPLNSPQKLYRFPELRAGKDGLFDTFKGLPGLLADSLPDKYGNQLMNVWLTKNNRLPNSMNPVEQLCFIGKRGMGALEFDPQTEKTKSQTFSVEFDSLVQVAKEMLTKREAFETTLNSDQEKAVKEIITIGTSAGGARPKAVISYNQKTGEVRSGQTKVPKGFEHWLIKLDGVSDVQLGDSKGYGRVEMAYALMAKDAGIEMMPSRLLEENGRAHFMTKRFDREKNGIKHHVQTWCAMSHLDFNEMLSYSYEQLFQTMRELRLSYPEAEQMFRRMVFNVLGRNCDDHTKNFGFMLKKNQNWELAPAYDLCFAYREDSLWVNQHTLSINGKRKDIRLEDFLAVAKNMNIKNAQNIINEVSETVKNWSKYAELVHVDAEKKHAIQRMLPTL